MSVWRFLVQIHTTVSRVVLGRKRVERVERDNNAAAERLREMEQKTQEIEATVRPIAKRAGLVLPNGDHE